MANIQVSNRNVSSTGITPRQTEQLYEKMSIVKRQMLFEQYNQLTENKMINHFVTTKFSVPSQWFIQTLDTWRYFPFTWSSLHFQRIPEISKEEDLFRNCMQVLEVLSLPICYATCRYENLRKSGGQVISVEAPISCLTEFVNVHKCNGENGNYFHELRVTWKNAGLSEALFRQMALMIFKFRQHGAVPFIILHSAIDKKSLWICFRDYQMIVNDSLLKSIIQIVESNDERVHPETPLKTCTFIDWPIIEHSNEVDIPRYLCQNLKCLKGNNQMVDDAIRSKFSNHVGPKDKLCAAFIKRRMGDIWHDKYEPLLVEERDKILKEEGKENDKSRLLEIQNQLLDKYEKLASVHEDELKNEWETDNYNVKMKRCSGCKKVYYCSASCQKTDWSTHKLICSLLSN